MLCLYIKLATVRARRETTSYGALLAARQSWETWYRDAHRATNVWLASDDRKFSRWTSLICPFRPHVRSPCRADQAAWWLHSRDQQQNEDCVSTSPPQVSKAEEDTWCERLGGAAF